jgi:hypothetical protein
MSTRAEFEEIEAIVRRTMQNLVAFSGKRGRPGADLRRAVGDLLAGITDYIADGTFADRLLQCFKLATSAGITLNWMDTVIEGLIAEPALLSATKKVGLAVVADGGSGHAVNDTINLGHQVYVRVNTISDGGTITAVRLLHPGSIDADAPLPVNPVHQTATTGDGVDAAFNLTWVADRLVSLTAVSVVQNSLMMAMAQEGRIIRATTFVSRDDVDIAMKRMKKWFDAIRVIIADTMSGPAYEAFVTLCAGITRYLTDTARPLPRMLRYNIPASMPGLTMSNYIYGEGKRAEELAAENKVVHPAFMPRRVRALNA